MFHPQLVQLKLVAAFGFAKINVVCWQTTALLLCVLQAQWGCHTLRL